MPGTSHPAVVFRFGVFEVDVAGGELRKHGLRVKLQNQPFQILLILLEHAGEIVEREEFFDRLWPSGTFVDFEQGLATAVRKLRQALDDDPETPRYVETLPKRGYRFIAPTEHSATSALAARDLVEGSRIELPPPESPTSRLPMIGYRPAPPMRLRPLQFGAVLVASVILAGIGFGIWRQKQAGRAENPSPAIEAYISRPLTTLPGGEYEPALSPDGKMFAFIWDEHGKQHFHVYTQAIDVGEPVRLTTGDANEGTPVWSPDGRYVAFITCTENAAESGIYIVPVASGAKRKIASIAPRGRIYARQIDWSPDGSLLALTDRNSTDEPWAIYLLSLNTGAKRRLLDPVPASPGDSGPVFSPNGRQIAFRRSESIGNNDIYAVSVAGGKPRRVTYDKRFTSAHAWTRDGNEIVFTSKRAGPISLWRVKLSGGPPQPIAGSTEGASYLMMARNADRLIYSRYLADSNIWETELPTCRSRCVLNSTRSETSPQYSPDGTRIAFRSDRTGTDEIWVAGSSGDHAIPVTSFNGPLTGTPRWSPDGEFIAFDSRPNGNPDIYVVSANGGPPRRVTSAPAEDVLPSWSREGRWLYFASNRSGRWQVWKIASDATNESATPIQLTRQGGFSAFESPDGKSVFYAKGRDLPGIWSVSVSGGRERLVTGRLQPGYWGNWGVAQTGLFLISPVPPDGAAIDFYGFREGAIQRIAVLDKPPPFSDSGFGVRRDGRKFLHAQMDHISSEILLIENFR